MIDRRKILSGLAGLGACATLPALAQAIRSQSDPYAQVDPYADPRNGFPSDDRPRRAAPGPRQNPVFDYSRNARPLSEAEQREELDGALSAYRPFMEEDGGPIASQQIQRAVGAFIKPLASASDRPDLPWEAHVCRSMDINAWTVGAGKLSFNAGLIAMCDHPGEFAAVVAHEMGHVVYAHCLGSGNLRRAAQAALERGMDIGATRSAGDVVSGDRPKDVRSQFDILRAGYSRQHEYQADEYSVELLRRIGMSPKWSVSMLDKLARNGFEHGHHMISTLVIDHPQGKDRADHLRAIIGFDARDRDDYVPPGWDVLKTQIPTEPKWRNS